MTATPPPSADVELLACPMCGASAAFSYDSLAAAEANSTDDRIVYVGCTKCGLGHGHAMTEPQAIAWWNRRPQPAAREVEPKWLEAARARIAATFSIRIGSDIHLLEMAVEAYVALRAPPREGYVREIQELPVPIKEPERLGRPDGHILAEAPAVADVGHTTDLREIQERKASRDTGGDIEHETTLINRGAEDITTLLSTVARLTARVATLESQNRGLDTLESIGIDSRGSLAEVAKQFAERASIAEARVAELEKAAGPFVEAADRMGDCGDTWMIRHVMRVGDLRNLAAAAKGDR